MLAAGRFVWGLRDFLRTPLTAEECRAAVRAGLAGREENFLGLLERAVFGSRPNPYLALFRQAGAELGDVRGLVADVGLEGALASLRDAGVYLTFDEFRGRRPIVRPGLELHARPGDFDAPSATSSFPGATGGSSGTPRPLLVDLASRERQAVYHSLFLDAFDAWARPVVVWRPVPPGLAGLTNVLALAKLGRRADRWFSPTKLTPRSGRTSEYLVTLGVLAAARLAGRPLPRPEHVPIAAAGRIARVLDDFRREGRPALVATTGSSAVRVCAASTAEGLDLSGTLFRVGGEPFTPGKARAIRAAGGEAVGNYTMSEAGRIGIACADPAALDDYHVLTDKLAVLQPRRDGDRPDVLCVTALLPSNPKLMINVEVDDYGTLETRGCGCPLGALGLTLHVREVRSYEKLTSEGVHFLGSRLIELVDEVLPAAFGGAPTDYQLVEEELDGLPKVSIVVSPRVGSLDERAVASAVLGALAKGPSHQGMMADIWRAGETVQVVRREPYETAGAKILPLHVLDGRLERGGRA